MKIRTVGAIAAVAALCIGAPALAQDEEAEDLSAAAEAAVLLEADEELPVGDDSVAESAMEADTVVPVQPEQVTIPRLTEIYIELLDEVSSATAASGETFRIRLASPIVVDGVEVVPAGPEGMGEVVHAKRRGGGSGGELIVAARYLEHNGQQIPLRSMRMTAHGKDRDGERFVATAVVGVLGLLVKGEDTVLEVGRVAQAKIAQDTEVAITEPESDETNPTESEAPDDVVVELTDEESTAATDAAQDDNENSNEGVN